MDKELKQKAFKGLSWSLLENVSIQTVKFIFGIILARLLTPKDFGLIAMITVFFAIAEVFIQGGFVQAYVQKMKINEKDSDTIFFTNLLISLVFYGILWISAPMIANFYDQSQLITLTRVMALILIINSFSVIQIAQLTRDVDFKRKAKITLFASIISGLSGITAAYFGYGVWSLVLQQLLNRCLFVLGLWFTSNWIPRLQFSKESFKELFSFGSWLLLSAIFKKLFDNIYVLTIGKTFPAESVGFFQKSQQFAQMASNQITAIVNNVSFPILSKLQHERLSLKNSFSNFLQYTMLIVIPLSVIVFVISKAFVLLLLTDKWAPMIPFMKAFAIIGIVFPLRSINYQLILALGKGKLSFYLSLMTNGFRLINIILMYRFGIIYIIIGEGVLSLMSYIVFTFYTKKFLNYSLINQLTDLRVIILSGIFAGVISIIIIGVFNNLYLVLFLGIVLTSAIFFSLIYILNKHLLYNAISYIKEYLHK